jgi:hypothetical protein
VVPPKRTASSCHERLATQSDPSHVDVPNL